jgi:uncharacterized protein (UPF0332 family)
MNKSAELFAYRWQLALETLDDARKMAAVGATPRSIVNRVYYAMFYAVVALFLKVETPVKSSRHSGLISMFDTVFIRTNKLPKELSRILHRAFDERQEFDYKDHVNVERSEAEELIIKAQEFITTIDTFVKSLPAQE